MVTRFGRKRGGNNLIEFSLFVPWFIFLFVGVYDFGFYGYSLIATTASARAAAGYCAQSSSTETACNASTTTACTYALDTLKFLPNVSTNVTSCGAAPVTLSESSGTDAYSNPYVVVTVAYTSPKVIPIPGLLPGQITVTRAMTMPVR